MIFIDMKRVVYLVLLVIAAMAIFVFYKTYGLSLLFLLVIGLLALKFIPVLVLPILLVAIGVYFSGGFSFIADGIVWGFWSLVSLPICFAFIKSVTPKKIGKN